jgi:hypothetical protein
MATYQGCNVKPHEQENEGREKKDKKDVGRERTRRPG